MNHDRRVELLKDVLTLIHPEMVCKTDRTKRQAYEERKHRVEAWLKDILQATSHEECPWGPQIKDNRAGPLNLLPQFMQLLRECVLTHQWTQVLSMLNCISHIPYGADWVTWKTTLTVLYDEPEDNVRLIQDFYKHAYLLKECNVRDVALEFVQYLLSQGLTQEASEVMKSVRKKRAGVCHKERRDFTQHLMNLLDAYQGLVFYVDWKAAISKETEFHENSLSQSFYDLTSSQGLSEDAIKSIGQRALLGLRQLVNKHGVWDIFLTKAVEIHKFYNEFDEADILLRKYQDKNPDNPNAYRLLYEYLSSNSEHFDEAHVNQQSCSCLKDLAKLDPANPLVLTLWQKLTDEGDINQAVCYIFDLLDYTIWKNRTEAWNCFSTSLTAGLSKETSSADKASFVEVVKNCWLSRRGWWPDYQFQHLTSEADDQTHLSLVAKVTAAAVLMGKNNAFVKTARKMMKAAPRLQLDQNLSALDWDVLDKATGVGHLLPDAVQPDPVCPISFQPPSEQVKDVLDSSSAQSSEDEADGRAVCHDESGDDSESLPASALSSDSDSDSLPSIDQSDGESVASEKLVTSEKFPQNNHKMFCHGGKDSEPERKLFDTNDDQAAVSSDTNSGTGSTPERCTLHMSDSDNDSEQSHSPTAVSRSGKTEPNSELLLRPGHKHCFDGEDADVVQPKHRKTEKKRK